MVRGLEGMLTGGMAGILNLIFFPEITSEWKFLRPILAAESNFRTEKKFMAGEFSLKAAH